MRTPPPRASFGYALLTLALLALPAALRAATPVEVQQAKRYSRVTGQRALLIEQNGKLVCEDYTNGGAENQPHHIRSITKSLWALAILKAADQGIVRLDEPVSATITEWKSNANLRRITVRQLLNLTSGIAPSTTRIYRSPQPDIVRAAVNAAPLHAPGGTFEYGPAAYEVAGEFLRRKLAQEGTTPEKFLSSKVLAPAGVRSIAMKKDDRGIPYRSAGASMTAPDLLKLGRIYLNGGASKLSRVVSRESFATATHGTHSNPSFGMGVWLNVGANRPGANDQPVEELIGGAPEPSSSWGHVCIAKSAPTDMMVLLGSSGQRVYIVPSMDLVIVRLGEGSSFRDAPFWDALTGKN